MPNPFKLPMARRSIRNAFSRPATRRYPAEVRPPFHGARGTLQFDLETCVFCGLCVRRCPTVALSCSRDEKWFAIEQLRCIACGVCIDVCNKNSLSMSAVRRQVQTQAEAGPDGRRPGHEEWHKQEPAAVVSPVDGEAVRGVVTATPGSAAPV